MPFKKPHVNVGVSDEVHRRLVFFAFSLGMTISDLADEAITRGLDALAGEAPTQEPLQEVDEQVRRRTPQ